MKATQRELSMFIEGRIKDIIKSLESIGFVTINEKESFNFIALLIENSFQKLNHLSDMVMEKVIEEDMAAELLRMQSEAGFNILLAMNNCQYSIEDLKMRIKNNPASVSSSEIKKGIKYSLQLDIFDKGLRDSIEALPEELKKKGIGAHNRSYAFVNHDLAKRKTNLN